MNIYIYILCIYMLRLIILDFIDIKVKLDWFPKPMEHIKCKCMHESKVLFVMKFKIILLQLH